MEDYFDSFSEDITKWELIKDMIDLDLDDGLRNDHKTVSTVQLLPRRDVVLYGTIPKMEQRIFTKCKECRLVFNPKDILLHRACPGKSHHSSTSHSLKKKVKSKGSCSKKSHSNLPPPPLFKKTPSPAAVSASVSIPDISYSKSEVGNMFWPRVKINQNVADHCSKVSSSKSSKVTSSAPSTLSSSVSSTSKSESRVSSSTSSKSSSHSPRSPSKSSTSEYSSKSRSAEVSSSSSSSSKHKKSKRSSSSNRSSNSHSKVATEFDPDVHCGVVEGSRGPCTKSITCNNHRIQLRKLVTGRSKDIHQLIAERKTVKEKEPKQGSNCSYTSPNGQLEEPDSFSQNITYEPAVDVGALANANEPPETKPLPVVTKNSEPLTPTTRQITSAVAATQPPLTDNENGNTKTINNNYVVKNMPSLDINTGPTTVPVVYMPMSLISFVQIGKNVVCLKSPQTAQLQSPHVTTQSVYLTIPSRQSLSTQMYRTHPRPVAVPNYGGNKVISHQRLECQRNDILKAINTKRKTINNAHGYRTISVLNHTNTPHRPNILKVKTANKVNCKRTSVDKITTCDSKQMRLPKLMGSFCSPI